MKRFLVCMLCLLALSSADGVLLWKNKRRLLNESSDDDDMHYFLQKVDHSDPTNPGTWWQRYQVNDVWFKHLENSPIFLTIEGEMGIWMAPANKWTWADSAESYGALSFDLEHRFYGDSQPTGDLSVKSLRYLTSEQALADVANFIEGMNQKYNLSSTNKWIVSGGSYAGSLAAWARLKYPHLIHAAVSTSGPVLAQMNFKGYDEVVRQALTVWSPQCAINVHKAALEIEDNLTKPGMAAEYSKKFHLESPLDVKEKMDVTLFFASLADVVKSTVQFNDGPSVDNLCSIMTNETIGTVVDRYAAAHLYSGIYVSYHKRIVDLRRETTGNDDRSWLYQTCTEFGWYQTSGSRDALFGYGVNLQYFIDKCQAVFGEDFDATRVAEGVKRSNIIYGQKDIVNHVSNVIFVHGSLDPWHVLGVYKSTNPQSPAILIEGTSHCRNMAPPSSTDPPQLVEARKKINEFIKKCLSSS